jgi:hypothetical protein
VLPVYVAFGFINFKVGKSSELVIILDSLEKNSCFILEPCNAARVWLGHEFARKLGILTLVNVHVFDFRQYTPKAFLDLTI